MPQLTDKLSVLRHYMAAKWSRKRFRDRAVLLSWQDRKVQAFLRDILPKSKFYRDYYSGLKHTGWQHFPMIDKSVMMANFNALNTVGIEDVEAFKVAFDAEHSRDFKPMLKQVSIGLSSGTSGHRGLFLVSRAERLKWAGTVLSKVLPASIFASHKIAFFLRANSNLYMSVGSRNVQFRFFDLMRPIEQHVVELNSYQPSLLVAPPSMLCLVAKAYGEGRLTVYPKKVISVAEVLEPSDRQYLERVFRQTVHQVYQCTEGFLAHTCQYGTLHINEDLLVVQKEYLEGQSRFFTPIITDFSRTTQPIIRYRLNDILMERETSCPCGSVFMAIDSVDGRCDDLFYLASEDNNRLRPIFPDFIRRAILEAPVLIQDYQVFQHAPNALEVALLGHVSQADEETVAASIGAMCQAHRCIVPEIRFVQYQELAPGSKKRRLQRTYSIEGVA